MTRKPLCMDAEEFAAWAAKNEALRTRWQAASPCVDCQPSWAAEMRDAGLCDGTPRRSGVSKTADYKRDKQRTYRRRKGMVDRDARIAERVAQAVALRSSGLLVRQVAEAMGVQRQSVTRYLRRAAT